MLRRTFLETAAGAGLQAAAFARQIRLGFDTYSIRDFRWKAIRLLDYAASLKLDALQFSGLGDYESLEPAHLGKVRDHAARLGLLIDAGIGCICPDSQRYSPLSGPPADYLLRGLQVAKLVGARVMRCFMGGVPDRRGPKPVEALIEATVKVLRSVRSQALDAGVKIAVENHGDMQARELKSLIEEAGKDFVGACLDTGNPVSVIEDPLTTIETLGSYILTAHVRDSVVYEHPRGAAFQWVALGDGSLDWSQLLSRYRELCPHAAMHLEIITGRPPQVLPYWEPDFWLAFPRMPAAEFARFAALAKRGHPFMGAMMIGGSGPQPAEFQAALREQQRWDLERSLDYAKKTLGAGIRWRG